MSANKSFRISGIQADGVNIKPGHVRVTTARRLLPCAVRDSGAGVFEVKSDEVARVELENGFVLWTRTDDLIREHGLNRGTERGGEDVWEVGIRPSLRGADRGERGWLGLGIRVLDFFGVDLSGKTAHALCDAFELKQLKKNPPGLYRCTLKGTFSLQGLKGKNPMGAPKQPVLLFLHGTASSCEGSFGKLWAEENAQGDSARASLYERYGDRAFAWEHRSLTESPIRNALELARLLPADTDLHLVSHSRGGLVGELLCLGQRDKENDPLRSGFDQLFAADRTIAEQLGLGPLDDKAARARDAAYDQDRAMLAELRDLLDGKRIKVGRFVRVACQARGTTLASGRLDRWLSVLDHLSGEGLFGDVVEFLLAVVKERTDPRTLPGLEAMMPGSAVTRLLHHPNLKTQADLSVISGDIEGDNLWGQIKLLAADWFYGADHDLVVNTGSMYGGIRRLENGARFQFDQGPKVCHFNYFENEKSIRWLVSGLTRGDMDNGGFRNIEEAKHAAPRWREAVSRSRADGAPKPLAVVLPGTMGSALSVRGEAIWLKYWPLMWGGLERLNAAEREVEATDLLDDFYAPLLEFLARSHRVEILPYDWRDSVRVAAARLAEKLEAWLPEAERTGQPVHLIAHSMGGLVVRALLAEGARGTALWRRIMALPNSRFMMLGTPNHGSYEAVRWLTGHNPTQAKLTLLDMTHGVDGLIRIVREYPGLLELLPFADEDQDFSQADLWKNLKAELAAHWDTAPETVLGEARKTWATLKGALPDPNFTVYVAGSQPATVADYRLVDYDESHLAGRKRIDFLATGEGDGTVTWKSGAIGGVPVWYAADTAHDELCLNKRAFTGYLELLMNGKTTRLAGAPPERKRDAAERPALFSLPPAPPIDGMPDEASLRGFGFGPSRPYDEQAMGRGVPPIKVSVRHGDLAYATHPVLVGHYLGDTIISAERALDKRLANALAEKMKLGIYPGRLGSHALFFNAAPGAKPGGAIVVGLGQVGEISPNRLTSGIRDALLEYALEIAQWPDARFGPAGKSRSANVTSLLVATGAGGMSVRDSVAAILRGAVAANRKLVESGMEDRVLIDRVEFMELYESVALTAARSLAVELTDGELAAQVEWPEQTLEEGQGGLTTLDLDEKPGWWQRLEIIRDPASDMLRFIATTDRARAEETLATGQLRLADSFVRQASQSARANPEVAKTLFEMLLPNRLKELTPKQDDMVLLLDDASARFPWELLEDRWSQSGRPPAVANGLVRQRKTPKFRPHPAHAIQANALVIGNPDLEGWDRFSDLPGARAEAQKVVAALNQGKYFRVVDCIDEKADAILASLHKDAWRILHLAGHGVHEWPMVTDRAKDGDNPCPDTGADKVKGCVSGMVIGKNTILKPGDVQQMRWVPELVFINCCHLGKTGAGGGTVYGELAANLAMEFIDMGVKAVVAAGWAVDDAAAEVFAETFYGRMLAGDTFGEAVRAAREAIWLRFPGVNTWGAYQCYGDPGYQLRGDGGRVPRKADAEYLTPHELIVDLDNYKQRMRMEMRIKGDDEDSMAALRDGIGAYLNRVPAKLRKNWAVRADVAAALGYAWGEIAEYRKAAEWLDQAIRADKGRCDLLAVEQCANFHVRAAAEDWGRLRSAKAGKAKAGKRLALIREITSARDVLQSLVSIGATVERWNLIGSANKRLASVTDDPDERKQALSQMEIYYGKAYAKTRGADESPDLYAFGNWALARVLAFLAGNRYEAAWQQAIKDECQKALEVARNNLETRSNDFWAMTAEADIRLVLLMVNPRASQQQMSDTAADILDIYRVAGRRGASRREWASVREHLDFLLEVTEGSPDKLRAALATIRKGVQ